MDFWDDQRGVMVGDPINGHFVLLKTNDGGETWQELDTAQTPKAMEGEAVFAASGTSLRCWGKESYGFVHNSSFGRSHLCVMHGIGTIYRYNPSPSLAIISQSKSAGPFSFSKFKDGFVVVGGDYLNDTLSETSSEFVLEVGYPEWQYASNYCFGYRSCVEPFSKENLVACGTTGVDVFTRPLWNNVSSESFHVTRKAKKGKAVFLAGPNGKIGKLIY
jgi:hypothetical protein